MFMKKLILSLIILLMIGFATPISIFADESDKSSLNLSDRIISLNVRETYETNVPKNKIIYSNTYKDVITVLSNGNIYATNPGVTVIAIDNVGYIIYVKENNKPLSNLTDNEINAKLLELMLDFPEGTPLDNSYSYTWLPGVVYNREEIYDGGKGCHGFAMNLSDLVFDLCPVKKYTDPSQIRIGDIIRINGGYHTAMVVNREGNQVLIVEGNYVDENGNHIIHWGRILDIYNCGFSYGYTRRA